MRPIAITLFAAATLSACGADEAPETPVACVAPAAAYLQALEEAPAEVRLDGDVAISSCLVSEQEPGALASVGESVVEVANRLNAQIRRDSDPDPQTIIALGYLVGAVERGAEGTSGIHQDLRLRINSAARFTPADSRPFGAEFERTFGEGYAAAQANG